MSKEKSKKEKRINQKITPKQAITDLVIVLLACCLWAFAANAIMIPNGLTDGGITGIARMLQKVTPLSFSLLYYALSVVVLIAAFIILGVREFRKIVFVGLVYPLILMAFEHLNFALLESNDTILAAIFYGFIGGLGSGLLLWRGYSSAGTDCIAKILKKKLFPEASLSKILLVINSIIIASSGFIFGRNIALYALISQYISSRMVDAVLFGFETKIVRIEIIAHDDPETTAAHIMETIGRGVTATKVVGAYTGVEHTKLEVICSLRESTLIRRYIATNDPHAFVSVYRVDTVWGMGTGFRSISAE